MKTGLKGRVVTWFISNDFKTTQEELAKLGVTQFPTNAPKTTLKKAVDIVKKKIEQDVKLPSSEHARKVQTTVEENYHGFALVIPYLDDDQVYRVKTALSVKVHKAHATLEFRQIDSDDEQYEYLCDQIRESYSYEKDTIDADQFRNSVVKRFVTEKCNPIPMRTSGGVYFIDDRYSSAYQELKTIFDNYPTTTKFTTMIVYDDDETLSAIEDHSSRKFTSDFVAFESDLQKQINTGKLNTVTFRKMKEKFEEKILVKAKQHKDNLRTKYEELQNHADSMIEVMRTKLNTASEDVVEVFDFGAAMVALADSNPREETDLEKALRVSQELQNEND